MKIMSILAGIWLGLNFCTASAQVVKDPLLDYYKQNFGKAEYNMASDPEGPSVSITPQIQVYYFEADFPNEGQKSFFITDDTNRQGPHGTYGWSVYCPLPSGGYQKLPEGVGMGKYGPAYIGPVAEIKGYGIVDSAKHVVSVQYLNDGKVKITFLGKGQEAEKEDYPQYFSSQTKWKIQKTTLAQLAQKYGKGSVLTIDTR